MSNILKQAFEYHHYYNNEWLKEIKNNFDKLPSETFSLFCHVLNAHQIWNARILSTEEVIPTQLHRLELCDDLDKENYKNSIHILDSFYLETVITYTNSRGETYSNKREDILFHIINHSTHHKAQIASQFRQAGIVPLISDYIFYKR